MIGFQSRFLRWRCDRDGCAIKSAPNWDWMFSAFPRGIRPTDGDGNIEMNGNILTIEWKGPWASIPTGQLGYFRALARSGHHVLVLRGERDGEDLEWLLLGNEEPDGFKPTTRSEVWLWLERWAKEADAVPYTR